jgi:nucleotidyltransferase substrate binding protein (TIGR01987 family)
MTKLDSLLEDLESITVLLEEILAEDKNIERRDAAIKRFELAFELAWKVIKVRLESEYFVVCRSPKNCFREAFRVGFLPHDLTWIDMTVLRNYSTHAYNEDLADYVYGKLPATVVLFRTLLDELSGGK